MDIQLKGLRTNDNSPPQTVSFSKRLFSTSGPSAVPMTCQTIVQAAKSTGTKNSFLNIYSLQEGPTSVLANASSMVDQLKNQGLDVYQRLDDKEGFSELRGYVDTLKNETLPVVRLVKNCLRESVQPDLSSLQEKRQQAEESRRRYEVLTSPEQEVSYYEGWFPLFRPMSESALFGVFGTALFLLLASVGIFLSLQGITLELKLPQAPLFEFSAATLKPYFFPAVGLGVVLTYLGTRYGWF